MRIAIAMSPGTITVPKFAATRPRRGRMLPKTRITRIGWVRVERISSGGVARGDDEVAAQEGEEGGHSRSPRPVRWM